MLTKEKRNTLIAGLLVVTLAATAGCGNNQPQEKDDEDEEARHIHTPVYIPSSSGSTSSTPTAGITSSKPPASSAKVAAPASGKTGISTGAARSSAVS